MVNPPSLGAFLTSTRPFSAGESVLAALLPGGLPLGLASATLGFLAGVFDLAVLAADAAAGFFVFAGAAGFFDFAGVAGFLKTAAATAFFLGAAFVFFGGGDGSLSHSLLCSLLESPTTTMGGVHSSVLDLLRKGNASGANERARRRLLHAS